MKELVKAFLEGRRYEYGPYRVRHWASSTWLAISNTRYMRMLEKHSFGICVYRSNEVWLDKQVSEFIQALGPNYDHNMESYEIHQFTPIKMIKAGQQLKLF